MNNTQIVPGSISAMAQTSNKPLALSIMGVDIVILVDTSGSMATCDSRDGKSRYAVACEELAALQQANPGKILVLSFSDTTEICLGGIPRFQMGGTYMGQALRFAKQYDLPDMKFFLLSDGDPQDGDQTLEIAKTYTNHISTIYVGPESNPLGLNFLQKLAMATGGQHVTADRAKELAAAVTKLLLNG